MDFNKKKLNLNKKLIFYLAIVMISVIVIMSLSINLSVKNKILYYSQSISNLSSEELIKYRDLILKDMKNLIIGISLLMIIVVIAVSVFLSQKISKPIIVVSKMTDFIKMGGYDQKLEYESSIVEIDNLINSINELSRELYKMENMRKNLTSDIYHQLRTPLTSIQSHLEAMIDRIWEPSKERLNSVNEEVIRLSHLVNQLKNLAKFDSYDDKLNLKNENLTQLIKNIIYNNESYALDKNIRIKYELEDVNANIDKEKISQVIINLISNAIRYTNLNGEILIKLYKKSDFIKIIVKDNGIGIPEESLDYIFERFYRVDKSRCRNTGGTGVGLTICKSIVDLHKGKIEVKSKLNEGSEFIITLPN